MEIKVLGPGCKKCITLEKRVYEALEGEGENAQVEKVTDYAQITSYGVLSTPGLVIDGEVVSVGKVPTVRRIQELIEAAR